MSTRRFQRRPVQTKPSQDIQETSGKNKHRCKPESKQHSFLLSNPLLIASILLIKVDVRGKFITHANTNTGDYTDKKFATNTDKSNIIQTSGPRIIFFFLNY